MTTMLPTLAVFFFPSTAYREKKRAARMDRITQAALISWFPQGSTMARMPSTSAPRAARLFQWMSSLSMRKARRVTKMGLPEKMTATTLAWPWVMAS